MAIEEAFDMEPDDEDGKDMNCLEDVVRAVERKLGGNGPPVGVRPGR